MHDVVILIQQPGFTGEGAYLIGELSIYNTISQRNIIKLATVLKDIRSQ